MMKHANIVKCPKCGADVDAGAAMAEQIRTEEQQKANARIAEVESGYKQKESALAQKEAALTEQQAEIAKTVAEQVRAGIARGEKEILKEAMEKAKAQYEMKLNLQSEETAELKKQLQESQTVQIENVRLKREMESRAHKEKLEREELLRANDEQNRKQYDNRLKAESENIAKREAERNEKQVAELQKQLADAKKAAEDAVRKAEQGSQQLQGEVQELMIEEFLRTTFPGDEIGEIPKGKRGADVRQVVRNQFNQELGVIAFESKDTKNWGNDWIDKLKTDASLVKADVAVLVTKVMPKGMDHLDIKEGVWVCPVSEFKGLAIALREHIVRLGEVRASQTNKGEKMQMLYDYLTDVQFAEKIKRVLSGFKNLQESIEKEKSAMKKIWDRRDKELEIMMLNTSDFVTQIQAIAGSSLPRLESPEDELLELGNV